jgi:hypothetical protein
MKWMSSPDATEGSVLSPFDYRPDNPNSPPLAVGVFYCQRLTRTRALLFVLRCCKQRHCIRVQQALAELNILRCIKA